MGHGCGSAVEWQWRKGRREESFTSAGLGRDGSALAIIVIAIAEMDARKRKKRKNHESLLVSTSP